METADRSLGPLASATFLLFLFPMRSGELSNPELRNYLILVIMMISLTLRSNFESNWTPIGKKFFITTIRIRFPPRFV